MIGESGIKIGRFGEQCGLAAHLVTEVHPMAWGECGMYAVRSSRDSFAQKPYDVGVNSAGRNC